MTSKKIIYYILAAFIAGNLLLIYLQYNSAKNINGLITGNERLVNEFRVDNQLHELEKDIISIENVVRSTIIAGDTVEVENLELKISEVEGDLDKLQKINDDDSSVKFIDQLDRLVREKIKFSNQVMSAYHRFGPLAAERMLNEQRGKILTSQILVVAHKIDTSRQILLSRLTESVDRNGDNARSWGTILIALVLLGGTALFWIIVNRIGQQSQLIRKLDASERKVREGAQVKENFMANMSHEIRTPLNAILGFTNLLQRRELDALSREYVATIQKSGENLLSIVNDILDLSKIEAGMMRIESAAFSLRGLLQSITTMFQQKTGEKSLYFTNHVQETIPDTLNGDATRLTQILVNLVANAIKFTDKGGIHIEIIRVNEAHQRVLLEISVIDTGVGIDANALPSIFERFRQAEDSITRKYGGTGLGLAIVKDLVTLQHGTIDVRSEPGKGTRFAIRIPYEVSADQFTARVPLTGDVPAHAGLEGLRVLVVEDNEINQTLMRHMLSEWKVEFKMAVNGIDALSILRGERFDLVLMDIQMPGMDGYTAATAIRSDLHLPLPIIAMTAHALPGEREKCLSFGMNDYLPKPLRQQDLYAMLTAFAPQKITNEAQSFPIIDLTYMKEVSGGNREYERIVTEQFIELIPKNLRDMRAAFDQKDFETVQRIAHDMKTSISVMGLTSRLQAVLDRLEQASDTDINAAADIDSLQHTCELAIADASLFLTHIPA